jgi:hypothetical protein
MSWIVDKIKGILLVTGALTFTMVYAAIAPRAALRSNFGEGLDGPVAEIVVRNWGALIALVGALLLAAAFDPPIRRAAVAFAGASKLVFILLVLAFGRQFLGHQVGVAVAVDSVMVLLFALYLLATRRRAA